MIKCQWVILCEKSIYSNTDRVSLIEIIDSIEVPPPPESNKNFMSFDFNIVISWKNIEKKEGNYPFRLKILNPIDELLLEGEHNLDFEESQSHQITNFNLPGLPISSEGDYQFIIECPKEQGNDWEVINSTTLTVDIIQYETN